MTDQMILNMFDILLAMLIPKGNREVRRQLENAKKLFRDETLATLPDLLPEEKALASQGEKITAIKLYYKRTGCGLKEAKDKVDRYIDN